MMLRKYWIAIYDENGALVGIVTDGDLRRHMGDHLLGASAGEVMTKSPKTIPPDMLVSAALQLMNSSGITAVFVVENGKPIGILHVHDLLRVGII